MGVTIANVGRFGFAQFPTYNHEALVATPALSNDLNCAFVPLDQITLD